MGKIRYDEKAEARIVSDTKLSKWTEKYPKRCVKFYGNLEEILRQMATSMAQ